MSDFDLFNQVLSEYKSEKSKRDESDRDNTSSDDDQETCQHINISTEKGVDVCIDCGEIICVKNSTNNKEWGFYNQNDSRHAHDPTRVQMRRNEERNIYKDVENMGFSEKIISEANKIYFEVTKGQIFRGNSRKALIFASIFHAYKLSGKPQSHEKLIDVFNLSRKAGLKGLKHVNLYAPKTSTIRTTYITPANLVEEIMDKFSATADQKKQVVELYNKIKNKSSRLNRSRPKSVSAGVVYYWIQTKQKDITLKQFAKKIELSELTISKVTKEITDVLMGKTESEREAELQEKHVKREKKIQKALEAAKTIDESDTDSD